MPRGQPENPFEDGPRARINTGATPRLQYPPEIYTNVQYADSTGAGLGGVTIDGQHVPWVADDDDESKPLTTPSPGRDTLQPSSGADFIRRQTMPRRAATTRQVKLTQGHWINE